MTRSITLNWAIAILAIVALSFSYAIPAFADVDVDDGSTLNNSTVVENSNEAAVINITTADANTGDNWAGGADGGNGGNGGDIEANGSDSEVDESSTGNAGNGGAAGEGGTVTTGDAAAIAGTENIVNDNNIDVDTRGTNPGDEDVDVDDGSTLNNRTRVTNSNGAFLFNLTNADAATGDNAASGADGGNGGNAGDVEANGTDSEVDESSTGNAGNGGAAGANSGGFVTTGAVVSAAGTVNVVNRNVIRVRR